MTSAVTLTAISKSFALDQPAALEGVHLDILPGSCTAILGPSGSGKSTILRIIAGLEDPSGGTVLVDGVDVTRRVPEQRGIGMVSQRPLLFPHLNVVDNVAFADRAAGLSRREARARARPFLDLVHMTEYGARASETLSGGQQQRIAIARALAARPKILLLDEPFSALDPALREDMHRLLTEVRQVLSPTILLVTHDREEAATVADRIAVVENGQLLQHDTVERLYTRPSSLAVARLMGGKNIVPGTVIGGRHVSQLGRICVDAGTPDGPAYLLVRQEALALATSAGAIETAGTVVRGTVVDITRVGPRRSFAVRCGEAILHADVNAGASIGMGDVVELVIPSGIACVVPG